MSRLDGTDHKLHLPREGFVIPKKLLVARSADQLGRWLFHMYDINPTVDSVTKCWIWPLSFNSHGYPAWWWNNSAVGARRWVYQQVAGRALSRRYAVKTRGDLCGTRECVRPSHLKAVTWISIRKLQYQSDAA